MLANAIWPSPGVKQREIVQKTPLVPHQGATLDCGVFSIIHFASLVTRTDEFLAAFEPGRRLIFPKGFAQQTRRQLLEWSTWVVNGYDVPLKDFYEQLKLIPEHFEVHTAAHDGEWALQQNAHEGAPKVRTDSLVRKVLLPDVSFLRI